MIICMILIIENNTEKKAIFMDITNLPKANNK